MNQITQAISFARDNFFYLFALCIPVLVLEGALASFIAPLGNVTQVEDIQDFMELNAVLVGLLGLALILVSITFIGALVSGYESINLSVKRTTIDLYSAGFRKFFILLGANILFVLAIMLGFIMLVLPAFYLMGRLSLFPSLIMFENEGVTKSLGRSWEMTDEYGGKLFGITLFFWGGTLITSLIIGALVPESTLQIFILLLIEYAIIIPWMYVYYSLYKSLSN
ncbi:MAG: hypothetical protein VW946_02915 [Gammaproteobacteria bacterium]